MFWIALGTETSAGTLRPDTEVKDPFYQVEIGIENA
jgi:hypothetical protein